MPKEIECDGKRVVFPELEQPTALALAHDGQLMVADSGTGWRQQILFYDIADAAQPKLTRAFGERGGIAIGHAGWGDADEVLGHPRDGHGCGGECVCRDE